MRKSVFEIKINTNRAVQPLKMAKDLEREKTDKANNFNVYIYNIVLCVTCTMLSILEAMKTFFKLF